MEPPISYENAHCRHCPDPCSDSRLLDREREDGSMDALFYLVRGFVRDCSTAFRLNSYPADQDERFKALATHSADGDCMLHH